MKLSKIISLLVALSTCIHAEDTPQSEKKTCLFYLPAVVAKVTNDYHQDLLVGSLQDNGMPSYFRNRYNNVIGFMVPSKQSRNGNLKILSENGRFSTVIRLISTHGRIEDVFESIIIDMEKNASTCELVSATCISRFNKSTCEVSLESTGGDRQPARIAANIKVLEK